MKTFAFILCLLSIQIFAQLENTNECVPNMNTYHCTTMKDDKCLMPETFTNGSTVYHLMSCMKSHTCYPQEMGMGICFKRKYKYFDGESCRINPECYSGVCTKEKCVGIPDGGVCDSDLVCLNQSYCNDGICQKIAKPGEDCTSQSGCPIGYACGKENPKADPKCYKLFSIETGQYTSNRLYCKSGFALNVGNVNPNSNLYSPTDPAEDSNFICAESKLRSEPKCVKNTDCQFEVNIGTGSPMIMTGKTCICTAEGTTGYCQITTDNPVWTRWIELYAEVVNAGLNDDDHVAYHRPLGWGNSNLIQAEQDINRYEKFQSADDCARRYLSGAMTLRTSLVSLALVALFAL